MAYRQYLRHLQHDPYHNISLSEIRMSVHEISLLQSKPCGWNSFGTSSGYSGLSRSSWSSWSRISILLRRGYCGNGIHCTGSLATWNCWLLECWGILRNLWKSCSQLELCRNWFLLALPWLDEVAVSPEALSSCWNLNHVGVGFSALLMYHSFFALPRIRYPGAIHSVLPRMAML